MRRNFDLDRCSNWDRKNGFSSAAYGYFYSFVSFGTFWVEKKCILKISRIFFISWENLENKSYMKGKY